MISFVSNYNVYRCIQFCITKLNNLQINNILKTKINNDSDSSSFTQTFDHFSDS